MNNRTELKGMWTDVKTIARTLWICIAVLWAIELADATVFRGSLDTIGLEPRSLGGLLGVLTAPLLHDGWGHLISNTIGFVIFGGLVSLVSRREFFKVTAVGWIVGGIAIWVLGRHALHIGLSGVIFAYFGYLLVLGWFERRLGSIVLSCLVFWAYGGLLWGMIPGFAPAHVSWEGHLSGFVCGVLVASRLRTKPRPSRD